MNGEGGVPEDKEKIVPNSSAPPAKQSGGNGDAGGGEMFAKAVAYCNAVTEGAGEEAEDIYLWEHGTAVEPWPEPVDGEGQQEKLNQPPVKEPKPEPVTGSSAEAKEKLTLVLQQVERLKALARAHAQKAAPSGAPNPDAPSKKENAK